MLNLKKAIIYTASIPVYFLSFLIIRDNKLWIFSSWYGKKYGDNPKYFYEYVSQQDDGINAYWITKSLMEYKEIKQNGVQVIYCYSIIGIWLQLRAGTAICSHSIADEFIPWLINSKTRKVNLWHGVPLKKIGKDVNFRKDGFIKNLINFLFPYNYEDYFLFASTSTNTNEIYEHSFTIPPNRVQAFGYPRNDYLSMQKSATEIARAERRNRFILYAPTYRNNKSKALLSVKDLKEIDEICYKFNIQFDIKLHPADYARFNSDMVNLNNIRLLNQSADLNEILFSYDLLISDYSGAIIDFLLLQRPIILYIFDYSEFKRDQGLYNLFNIFLEYGEVALDSRDLIDCLVKFSKYQFDFDNSQILNYCHDFKDNNASERYYRYLVNSLL